MLRLLAEESEGLGLHGIADALGLAKGTTHGLLHTLQEVGFVEQDRPGGPYRLVADVLRLGAQQWDVNELRARAINWSDALAARSGQAVRIAAYRDGSAVVVHHVFRAGSTGQSLTTGAHLPLHSTALGKVLLAHEPGAARAVCRQDLVRLTPRTVTDQPSLRRQLAGIRESGFAVSVEENRPGSSAIAAPIRDRGGHVVAAVSVEGPPDSLFPDGPRAALVDQVIRAGRSISRQLGHGRSR